MTARQTSPLRLMRAALLLVVGLAAPAFVHGQGQHDPTTSFALLGLARADSLLRAEYARDSLASITYGIVVGDSLVFTQSLGLADLRTKRAANAQTIYRIGSVTKSFTGVMLQQLMQRGAIRLHDSVVRHLPEFARVTGRAKGAPPVTVLQLATMTAGLPAEPREEGPFWTGRANTWESKLLAALPHARFEAPPGTQFAYSNLGYATLGAVLARAARMPFIQWQQTRILAPLGMRHTRFEYEPSMSSDLATGYMIGANGALDDSTAARELQTGRGYKVPAGAIFTTVGDLARFVTFHLGKAPESVLSHARLDSTYAGIVATSAELDMGYGLGFMAQRRGDFPWLGHSGGVPGYTAMMYFDREHQIGVIVLRNATGGRVRIGRVAPDMLRVLIDAKLEAAGR